jgi:hypothetical protein
MTYLHSPNGHLTGRHSVALGMGNAHLKLRQFCHLAVDSGGEALVMGYLLRLSWEINNGKASSNLQGSGLYRERYLIGPHF